MSIILRDKNTSANALGIDGDGKAKVSLNGETVSVQSGAENLVKDGKVFVLTTDLINISTNQETEFLLLKNPSGSGKTLFVNSMCVGCTDPATDPNFLKAYRNPTISNNGTQITPNNMFNGGASSQVQLYKIPTATDNGTLLFIVGYSDTHTKDMGGLWAIQAGESILFNIDADADGKKHTLSMCWTEKNNS